MNTNEKTNIKENIMIENQVELASQNANENENAAITAASAELQKISEMKKKLLFVEGNRQNIDKSNVVDSYNKIKALGFLPSMPIEYVSIEDAVTHLNGRRLYEVTINRKNGKGDAIISNFEMVTNYVFEDDYKNFDGVIIDGQHRSVALMFDELKDAEPSYKEVEVPSDMDILSYVALRNNGKSWKNEDFYKSGIQTGNEQLDFMLQQSKEYTAAFIFAIYTLPTASLSANQIKAIQLGYKKAADFGKLQLDENSQYLGDQVMKAIKENQILTKDKLNGRFGNGLKKFHKKHQNLEAIREVLTFIDKNSWNKHFYKGEGKSLEIKGYEEAFEAIYNECHVKDIAA